MPKFQCEFLHKGHGYESSEFSCSDDDGHGGQDDDEFSGYDEHSNEEYGFCFFSKTYRGRPGKPFIETTILSDSDE